MKYVLNLFKPTKYKLLFLLAILLIPFILQQVIYMIALYRAPIELVHRCDILAKTGEPCLGLNEGLVNPGVDYLTNWVVLFNSYFIGCFIYGIVQLLSILKLNRYKIGLLVVLLCLPLGFLNIALADIFLILLYVLTYTFTSPHHEQKKTTKRKK